MSDYDPPLVHLPGTRLTPEVVLHRTLNKCHRIKAVVVVIQWDDGSYVCDWSQMKVSEICMASLLLQQQAVDAMRGNVTLAGHDGEAP